MTSSRETTIGQIHIAFGKHQMLLRQNLWLHDPSCWFLLQQVDTDFPLSCESLPWQSIQRGPHPLKSVTAFKTVIDTRSCETGCWRLSQICAQAALQYSLISASSSMTWRANSRSWVTAQFAVDLTQHFISHYKTVMQPLNLPQEIELVTFYFLLSKFTRT